MLIMVLFVYSEKLQKKPTGLGRAVFVPASDASNRIAAIYADALMASLEDWTQVSQVLFTFLFT